MPIFGQGTKKSTAENLAEAATDDLQPRRPTMSERHNSHRLTLPGTESESDRAERREEAEEKATALRDDKLVEAAGVHRERLVPHEERNPGQKLTVENVGRLEREANSGRNIRSEFKRKNLSLAANGSAAELEAVERLEKEKSNERPRVERRWRDSERTVTGHD
jgi:hypothetical protein